MNRDICIVGILVDERACRAPEVQQVLTKHGSRILSRSGISDPSRKRGIITLVVEATDNERKGLEQDLSQVCEVTVKSFCLAEGLE